MKLLQNDRPMVRRDQVHSFGESATTQASITRTTGRTCNYQLWLNNTSGLIFLESAIQISGIARFPINDTASYSVLVFDENSNKISSLGLRPENHGTFSESSFTWDLKSKSTSFVESGRYVISLAEISNQGEIERCSVLCNVADTRVILSTTDLLKSSQRFANPLAKRVLSIYADIIRDIETCIIEGLKDNSYDEPYYVARTTAGFIQQIHSDIENGPRSQFRALIQEFVSKNPGLKLRPTNELGLRALFDFLVNYMAEPEDQARASAMVMCEYRNFTANDRSNILSALVSGILPHCMTYEFPNHTISRKTASLIERLLKVGIKYVCAKHIDRSISICQETLALTDDPKSYSEGGRL